MCDTRNRGNGMKKLLLLFVEATVVLAVGVGLLVAGIVTGIGAAFVVVGLCLFVLYAILLNQKYNLAWRRTCQIERDHELILARIEANKTVTLQNGNVGPATC